DAARSGRPLFQRGGSSARPGALARLALLAALRGQALPRAHGGDPSADRRGRNWQTNHETRAPLRERASGLARDPALPERDRRPALRLGALGAAESSVLGASPVGEPAPRR